jgi:hypothetical protein
VEGLVPGVRYPLPEDWPQGDHPLLKDWKQAAAAEPRIGAALPDPVKAAAAPAASPEEKGATTSE